MSRSSAAPSGWNVGRLTRPRIFAPVLLGSALALSLWLGGRGVPIDDEGAVLALAGRVLDGEVFYRDLDAYYFPGAIHLLAGWMALFGETVNAARELAALVFTLCVGCLYATSLRLTDTRRAALFGAGLLAFKSFAAPAFTSYMYSDVALGCAAAAAALLVRLDGRRAAGMRIAIGALLGLATASKQSLGVLALAAVCALFLLPIRRGGEPGATTGRRMRDVGLLALGFSFVALPLLGMFAADGVLGRALAFGFVRPFVEYLPTSSLSYGEPLLWWRFGSLHGMEAFPYFIGPLWSLLMNHQLGGPALESSLWLVGEAFSRALYSSVPLALGLVAWRSLRALRTASPAPLAARRFDFCAFAAAIFVSAFPRTDLYHVMSVYPFIFLLLFLFDPVEAAAGPRRTRGLALATGVWLAGAGALLLAHQALMTHPMKTARADLMIEPDKAWIEAVVLFLEKQPPSARPFFVYGQSAYYYFLADRYFPWPFVQVYPGMVGGEHGAGLARALVATPPSLVVQGMLGWPGMPSIPSYAGDVQSRVSTAYRAERGFFVAHPPAAGAPPPDWGLQILLPAATAAP